MWLLMRDKYGEDCDEMEERWLGSVSKEQATNPDGAFMKGRLSGLEEVSPLYYHRLEGDKGVTLSMGAYWRSKYSDFAKTEISETQTPLIGEWSDSFHGAAVSKGKNRYASWVWEAAQRPVGQCLPATSSDMAEWRWNMAGSIEGMGFLNEATRESNQEWIFPGGFCTFGSLIWISDNFVAEGQTREETAREEIAVAALPDDSTMIVLQRAKTLNRVILKTVKGLHYNVPNDLFNNCTRKYKTESSEFSLTGLEAENKTLKTSSKTIEIDKSINISSIYGIKELSIYRPGERQVYIFGKPASQGRSGGNLFCDEICHPCINSKKSYHKDQLLFDQGFVVNVNNAKTEVSSVETGNSEIKAVRVSGSDGKTYLMVANFAKNEIQADFELPEVTKAEVLYGKQVTVSNRQISLVLAPHQIILSNLS